MSTAAPLNLNIGFVNHAQECESHLSQFGGFLILRPETRDGSLKGFVSCLRSVCSQAEEHGYQFLVSEIECVAVANGLHHYSRLTKLLPDRTVHHGVLARMDF